MNETVWRRTFAAVVVVCALGAPAAEAAVDNAGKEFLLTFLPIFNGAVTVELHLTASVATDVTVEYPANSPTFTTTVSLTPGAVEIVALPTDAADNWTRDTVGNNAVRARANHEFVAYMVNRMKHISDAALALPVDTMNTEYIVATYRRSGLVSFDAPEFAVVAAYDDTTVTITPRVGLAGGRPAGVPFDVHLDAGEAYYGKMTGGSIGGYLTGTHIKATRPVGVTNGNICTNVPRAKSYCDHIFEVAQPVQSWGRSIPAANLPYRDKGSMYMIVGSEDGTTVLQDGVSIGTIGKGEVIEINRLEGDHVFSADKPIYAVQFMTSVEDDGTHDLGDPSMGNLVPSAQYLTAYTFSTVGGAQFDEHWLTVVAEDADVGAVLLDGVAIPAEEFTPIAGSGYSVARVELAEGTHSTSSPRGHGITVEGYNLADSYLYPGGARFDFINPIGDANPPECAVEIVYGPPDAAAGVATDDRPSEDADGNGELDEGEDLNGNGAIDADTGIFFVDLVGATNLVLTTDPFAPGAPSVAFAIALGDSAADGEGTLRATDGAGNVCETRVALSGLAPASCGDGVVQPDLGETCDPEAPEAPADCDETCTFCGDGIVDDDEECEPVPACDEHKHICEPDPTCSDACTVIEPFCGDGVVQSDLGETCDPADPDAPAGCRDDCSYCGDGVVDATEQCDGGPDCAEDCTVIELFCGDGVVQPDLGETCDPGDPGAPADCREDCTFCGDGVVDEGEACDGGPDCTDACTIIDARCGCLDLDEDGWPRYYGPCEMPAGDKTNRWVPECQSLRDCADDDPTVHPFAVEIPNDGIDQNCNSQMQCGALGDDASAPYGMLLLLVPAAGIVAIRRRLGA